MPTAVTNGKYRLKLGTTTEATIIADSASLISGWSYATRGRPWRFITDDLVTPYIERNQTGDGAELLQGKLNFTGRIAILNDNQLSWFWNTFVGNDPAPLVTIVTRNRLLSASTEVARWCTINCRMSIFDLNKPGLGSRQRQWAVSTDQDRLKLQFFNGSYASDSGTHFS